MHRAGGIKYLNIAGASGILALDLTRGLAAPQGHQLRWNALQTLTKQ